MKHVMGRWTVVVALSLSGASVTTFAQEMPPAVTAEDPAIVAVAERRSSGMVEALKLEDADKSARIKQHVVNFIITLKNIHEGKDAPTGDAKQAELEKARDALYGGLDAEQLTEAQKLVIKNGLSANHYRINYDAFLNLVPTLTDEEKQYIHEQLAEVCERAILLNSGEAKGELFKNRRGRINNYLSERGYDLKALSEVRNARLRSGTPSTQPTR